MYIIAINTFHNCNYTINFTFMYTIYYKLHVICTKMDKIMIAKVKMYEISRVGQKSEVTIYAIRRQLQ